MGSLLLAFFVETYVFLTVTGHLKLKRSNIWNDQKCLVISDIFITIKHMISENTFQYSHLCNPLG